MPLENPPPWEDELDLVGKLALFNDLQDDPPALLETIRGDIEFLVAIARADMRPFLLTWFSERPRVGAENGFLHAPERTGPVGSSAAGVEWSWTGTHDDNDHPGGAFNGITASGLDVTVTGFTLMSVENDRFAVRRYIDWAGLYAQLGLTLNWRTPVPSA